MNLETYINLISNSNDIKEGQTAELKKIVREYPYFQSARALYLKGLKNQESFRYNNELKVTAAFTSDRTVLFDFITSKSFEKKSDIHKNINKKIATQFTTEFQESNPNIQKDIDLKTPVNFSENETHSFQKWLQISTKKPIEREKVEIITKKSNKDYLIDRFIDKNPKIISVKKENNKIISITKNKSDSSLMTETLAKVYLEQKKFSEAIKAYEILSLKYPEKSGFFADQIKRTKILQNNKS